MYRAQQGNDKSRARYAERIEVKEEQTSSTPRSGIAKTSECEVIPSFTPGPWRFLDGFVCGSADYLADLNYSTLAVVTNEANGRLMAAAPALLAALVSLMPKCEHEEGDAKCGKPAPWEVNAGRDWHKEYFCGEHRDGFGRLPQQLQPAHAALALVDSL